MMFKSIRLRLALSFAGIALVAAVVLGVVLLTILQSYYSNLELAYLHGNARFISDFVMASDKAPHDEVQSQIENLAFLTQTRIQVYDASGRLLYDSGAPQKVAVNLAVMKQLIAQSNGILPSATFRMIAVNPNSSAAPTPDAQIFGFGSTSSPSSNTNGTIHVAPAPNAKGVVIYRSVQAVGSPFGFDLNAEATPGGARSNLTVTEPVHDPQNGTATGSVKLLEGPAYGSDILTSVARGWMLASAIAVLLAAAVGWYISRRISAPVLALTDVTARMAAGDLSSRANVGNQDEFGLLAHSFNEMADQVEGTVVALRRFVSDAAHELHSPLTALRTNLDLAADENNAAEQRVFIERAEATVARLETLATNLLDLSRIETKTEKDPPALTDLCALLQENGEVYASQAEQAGLTFALHAPDAPAVIRADSAKVQRALNNLVDNACKFTPAGGNIEIDLRRKRDQVVLSVTDSGIGIPADDLPLLFNRFHRGRNATAFPGSGLGLAIVKAIVEQEGGQVAVENRSPGARFSLTWTCVEK